MAVSKKAAARLETEIEKYRVECNWEKVTELIKNTKTKIPALGTNLMSARLALNSSSTCSAQ